MLMDSHAVTRNNTERSHVPFTRLPPMLTSHKTVAQCHRQIVPLMVYMTSAASPSLTCPGPRVTSTLRSGTAAVGSHTHHHSRGTGSSITSIPATLFGKHTTSPLPPAPSLATADLFSIALAFSLQGCYVNALTQHVALRDWLCPLSMVPWSSAQGLGIVVVHSFCCGGVVVHGMAVSQLGSPLASLGGGKPPRRYSSSLCPQPGSHPPQPRPFSLLVSSESVPSFTCWLPIQGLHRPFVNRCPVNQSQCSPHPAHLSSDITSFDVPTWGGQAAY